jgi:hypothetical protein
LPVPIFQALECFAIFAVLIAVEHRLGRQIPTGLPISLAVGLWGLSRFVDEYFWLGHDNGTDAVEIAGLAMFVVGVALAVVIFFRRPRTPIATGRHAAAHADVAG